MTLPDALKGLIEKAERWTGGPPGKAKAELPPCCSWCSAPSWNDKPVVSHSDDCPLPLVRELLDALLSSPGTRTEAPQTETDGVDWRDWRDGKPPNEQIVEVEDEDGRTIRVMAIWGRDGTLPHWESEDRNTHWNVSAFTRWRQTQEREPVTAGDLLCLAYVGSATCPTPACPREADVVDIGARRLLVCQQCGAHQGYTGWALSKIQEHREREP